MESPTRPAQETTTFRPLQKLTDPVLKFLIGDDIFVSYSRSDGATFAAGLATELTVRGFSCRLDQWGTESGKQMPKSLTDALRRSALLVLVGTEGAASSIHVNEEVRTIKLLKRPIAPIVFEGVRLRDDKTPKDGRLVRLSELPPETPVLSAPEAVWAEEIEGQALTCEDNAALETGKPSDRVLNTIEKTFTFRTRDQRLRLSSTVIGVVLLALIVASVGAEIQERSSNQKAAIAQARFLRSDKDAKAAAAEAGKQAGLAESAKKDAAEANTEAAKQLRMARSAERQTHNAVAARTKVEYETRIISTWQRAALRAGNDLAFHSDDDQSALLAIEALNLHKLTPQYPSHLIEQALQSLMSSDVFVHVFRDSQCRDVALSPGGRYLAAACGNHASVWDLQNPSRAPQIFSGGGNLPDQVMFGGSTGQILVFREVSGTKPGTGYYCLLSQPTCKPLVQPEYLHAIDFLTISLGGELLAASDYGFGNIAVWHLDEIAGARILSRVQAPWTRDGNPDGGIRLSPRGHLLASWHSGSDNSRTLKRWDFSEPRNPRSLADLSAPQMNSFEFGSESDLIFWDNANKVWAWDISREQTTPRLIFVAPDGISALATVQGNKIAVKGANTLWIVNSLKPGQPEEAFPLPQSMSNSISLAAFPSGKTFASHGTNESIGVLEIKSPDSGGASVVEGPTGATVWTGSRPPLLAFANAGQDLFVLTKGTQVIRWRVDGATPSETLPQSPGLQDYYATAPDASWALAGDLEGRLAVLKEGAPGSMRFNLPVDAKQQPVKAAFSPDAHLLALVLRGATESYSLMVCQVMDKSTCASYSWGKTPGHDAAGHVADTLSFSRDGTRLFFSTEGEVQVWDMKKAGGPILELASTREGFGRVTFSPEGDRFASMNGLGNVTIYRVPVERGRKRVLDLPPEASLAMPYPAEAVFSNDGDLLAVLSSNRGLFIWDLREPNAPPVILNSHLPNRRAEMGPGYSLAFSPDNQHIVAAISGIEKRDTIIESWPIWFAAAKWLCQKRIWRQMSSDEWVKFFSRITPQNQPCQVEE